MQCEICGDEAELLRHSQRWDFDVVRCRSRQCRMTFVAGSGGMTGTSHDHAGTDWDEYTEDLRGDDKHREEVLAHLRRELGGTSPSLFDIGAGSGEFVVSALARGFHATGNDISPTAIETARVRHGISLFGPDLSELPAEEWDAITMWCVLPHVADPLAMLKEVRRILKPDGILFLRVPRRCSIDRAGHALARVTRGRRSDLADWRVTPGHSHLFDERSMRTALLAAGYYDLELHPRCHYSLTTQAMANRSPTLASIPGLGVFDSLVARDVAPRNALFAYARSRP